MLRAFGHRVAMCCDMLGVVGSNWKLVKFEPTTPNMSQHGGQTHATCCRRWHVAIVWPGLKAPAKRSQHANATYRNNVGLNMLSAFGHRVAMCCDMLGVVGSNLTMVKFEPTTPNTSQHGGQTHATCSAQQCCDTLRWHVAIVWPGLK